MALQTIFSRSVIGLRNRQINQPQNSNNAEEDEKKCRTLHDSNLKFDTQNTQYEEATNPDLNFFAV